MGMSIKGLVRRELAKRKRASLSLSLALRSARLDALGAKIARNADVIPPIVPVTLPLGARRRRFSMQSCAGRDLIVRNLWYQGWNGFERPLPDLVARIAERVPGAFLDVGANTGLYSLIAARANERLGIYAFEPFPPVFELLTGNLALNGPLPSIRAERVAIGASSGTADLYVPLQDHGLVESSCSLDSSFKPAHSEVVQVPVVTLDEFVSRHAIADVSLVKVDVEGHEHAVLEGAATTIARFRPVIVFELLQHAKRDAIERTRVEQGYVSYRLRDGHVVPETSIDFDERAWNHIMVPKDRVSFLDDVLAGIPRER